MYALPSRTQPLRARLSAPPATKQSTFSPCGLVRTAKTYGVSSIHRVLLFLALTTCLSAEPIELLWPDLQGAVEEFEDPFMALDSDQLFHLGMVARLRGRAEVSDAPLPPADIAELEKRTAQLEAAGIDIDGLLAQRARVTELRRQRANNTREDYNGKTIRMPGYLLPLDVTEGEVTEYLLVPWVGACIHTPPPPPNQIVYVKTKAPWKVRDQWEPVTVEGTLQAKEVTKSLYFVDGSSGISIGYTLTEAVTSTFEDEE